MNAPIHPLNWIAPTPLWARVRDGDNPANDISRPALLRFASDAFMDELLNVMQRDPARVSDYLAQAETWRGMPQQPGREELLAAPRPGQSPAAVGALQFGSNASAVAMAVALLAFAWSWWVMPASLDGKAYYEVLFWGGGHALQFTWTILMLLSWLWLAGACGARVALSPRIVALMFLLALVSVFVTPLAYLAYDIASVEHRNLHTWAMRVGGGLAIAPVMLAVILAMLSKLELSSAQRPLRAALWSSMAVFALGGVIGAVKIRARQYVQGSNSRVPLYSERVVIDPNGASVTRMLPGTTRTGVAEVDAVYGRYALGFGIA